MNAAISNALALGLPSEAINNSSSENARKLLS